MGLDPYNDHLITLIWLGERDSLEWDERAQSKGSFFLLSVIFSFFSLSLCLPIPFLCHWIRICQSPLTCGASSKIDKSYRIRNGKVDNEQLSPSLLLSIIFCSPQIHSCLPYILLLCYYFWLGTSCPCTLGFPVLFKGPR